MGASFNGRIAVSKTANVGSIPTAPAERLRLSPVSLLMDEKNVVYCNQPLKGEAMKLLAARSGPLE